MDPCCCPMDSSAENLPSKGFQPLELRTLSPQDQLKKTQTTGDESEKILHWTSLSRARRKHPFHPGIM